MSDHQTIYPKPDIKDTKLEISKFFSDHKKTQI